MRKFILLICALLFSGFSLLTAQSIWVETNGVSPRDADSDTTDIFDRAYNGLLNVGVETQMYLKGGSDTTLAGPSWTVEGPDGSEADITITADLDSATQVAVFTTDVVGTYVVDFTDNGVTATLTINAGTYLG
ncbi:MAG: hypothetical protein GY808_06705, partial [Gammaproteobacteria bacterium]|nr:hypothetical protein [Gammaproteobacteria bacterium]